MCATATITAIGATHRREFITHKMFATGAAMAAPAKNAYLIYKIVFLQCLVFCSFVQIYLVIDVNSYYEIYIAFSSFISFFSVQ